MALGCVWSDAVAGVINFFLIHKSVGWRSGAVTGTQIWERPTTWANGAWIKAGTGDDKTDIVVVADFWERTGGLLAPTATFLAMRFKSPGVGSIIAAGLSLATLEVL